jgi:hypothetical protein
MTIVERSSRFLERHLSRRSFLVRGTFAATALAVTPKRYVLEPGTAYDAFCGEPQCGNPNCGCGSTCCQGFSTFCCTINGGYNYCPDGSIVGGWWAAADSSLCGYGTRYYLDCNGVCHCDTGCGNYYSNGGTFCDFGCDGLDCRCQGGNCNNWVESCFQFRYGQCNTDVGCTGRIICRIVSCVEPWKLDFDCGSSYMWDSGTAEMNAPCNTSVPKAPPPPCDSTLTRCETIGIASPARGGGYWLATGFGKVLRFGGVALHGDVSDRKLSAPIVAIEALPAGGGYWLAGAKGSVFNFGEAKFHGSAVHRQLPAPITAMASTPTGLGYWLVTAAGNVYPFGDAAFHGSLAHSVLHSPISSIESSATGKGYWLLQEDGAIYHFGDAAAYGSPAHQHPAYPVIGIQRSRRGLGYFVLGSRGAVWAYGDALMAGQPYGHLGRWDSVGIELSGGKGYWVTTADGGVFAYGGAKFYGEAN